MTKAIIASLLLVNPSWKRVHIDCLHFMLGVGFVPAWRVSLFLSTGLSLH